MDDEICTVTIDGSYAGTWYVPAQYVSYLENGTLYNNGSNTITLYSSKNHETYPRISIPALGYPVYFASSQYNGVTITNISRTDFNLYSQIHRFNNLYAQSLIFFLLLLLLLNRLIRGRGK